MKCFIFYPLAARVALAPDTEVPLLKLPLKTTFNTFSHLNILHKNFVIFTTSGGGTGCSRFGQQEQDLDLKKKKYVKCSVIVY